VTRLNVLLVYRDSQRTAHIDERWVVPAELVEEVVHRSAVGQRTRRVMTVELLTD